MLKHVAFSLDVSKGNQSSTGHVWPWEPRAEVFPDCSISCLRSFASFSQNRADIGISPFFLSSSAMAS